MNRALRIAGLVGIIEAIILMTLTIAMIVAVGFSINSIGNNDDVVNQPDPGYEYPTYPEPPPWPTGE